ncbi:UvrD-helicase domain-containing protein [Sphingomonadaceae bacterium G21617-S1]|jgi:DNA helicase II / ATP-dependent DNA helicase PcrA|uniref:UvrD-helicase domain-containing protein n=1 Tax=Sphingomonadales TaxID=204457 RepID=UPI0016298BC0|nr:UvrD-helicase domain-containing protein [Sphingomonas sp. NBWT7]MCZ4343951.1 UvrD-helicase domain-containing protein [Sphingomonadaceae bacterium G21617-S1]QNE33613.1 ATP-dependent helicase [Sphingomonas sp. NBWT7]
MADGPESPADAAGRVALERMFACLDENRSFRLEAGAGAGKTYSLEKALRRLIDRRGVELLRRRQQVGCITFTNVAKDEIISRIQAHPAVRPETVHGFCWSVLQDFQTTLRALVPGLPEWPERLEPLGGIGTRRVHYELGFPGVSDQQVTLRHEDVLALMIQALALPKFRKVLTARYPILLIDEYQDTDAGFVDALKGWFLDLGEGSLIGLFGDHWQKIYGEGCGLVEHAALEVIDKNANFRSVDAIVQMLNRMRPALPQMVSDPDALGEARVFHTNGWPGVRRTGQGGGHWTGDTSPEAARAYFQHIKTRLVDEGWDFAIEKTKILMLSHSVLAREQGYASIPPIYGQFNDPWLKKDDPHIKFLTDQLEPACAAFANQRYGEMFECFGAGMPRIRRHQDKVAWAEAMQALIALRLSGSIGEVIDFIAEQPHMRLPEAVEDREQRLADVGPEPVEGESRRVTQLRKLRAVPYTELIALDRFIDGHTPFATKHGVKGAEFENVLVIVGRGWNKYNFAQMLEWIDAGPPADKTAFFESNRNLFYVACSRPKVRLALLFTQILSANAMAKLTAWFGAANIVALPAAPEIPQG